MGNSNTEGRQCFGENQLVVSHWMHNVTEFGRINKASVQKSVNDDFSAGINVQRRGKFFQRAEFMDLENSGREEKNE